jgi:hypothetical protein
MGKLDAVVLTNFWPGTSSVLLRKGYAQHVTGITGQVETLMTWNGAATQTMFAAATTAVYNVTSSGAVGAAVKTGMTNARYQHINFTTAAGAVYLLAVNGADKLLSWNGSAWHLDGDGTHDITGFDTATATNITAFKNRIWLIGTNSLKAWYLQINAIAGAATALDMGPLCRQGGYLVAAMNWTIDGGYGVDDMLVFITSMGEVLVWRLTDPTSPTGISLVGVWSIGAPIGKRCWTKYSGDLLVITKDGIVPMSAVLQSSRTNPRVSLTDKIDFAVGTATTNYGSNFGWQLLLFAKEGQLILNVPVAAGSMQQQFVQNNITKAWCNFTGWEANCWELLADEPYFGGNGFVGHAWYTSADAGANIVGTALQSFQAYGGARQKQCKMIRYHLASNGSPGIYGNVNVDYDLADASVILSTSPGSSSVWGTGTWDSATWVGGLLPTAYWQGCTGIGYTFAPIFKAAANGIELEWNATDMVFEGGGEI